MRPRSSARSTILLAHSFYLRYDEKQFRKMKPYPPLGTLLTAAVLRERGFDVHLFDAMLSSGVADFFAALERVRPAIVGIVEDSFNFITKMCTLRMRTAAHEMIGAAKRYGSRVIVNGSDAIDHPDSYLAAGADTVIVGEVEPTFAELAEAWRRDPDSPVDTIAGLVLPAIAAGGNGGPAPAVLELRRTAPRSSVEDLDAHPFPAWDLIDVERYREAWTQAHGRLSWNVVTSRGCPYACNWCAKPLFGRRYAQRSPENVAEELRRLRDRIGPDHIWFADDIFGLTPSWIAAFAQEVAARDVRIPFMMQSRANLMKPRTVEALADAGAEEVWLGVESGSQRILDAMDKGTTVEQVREATRALKAHGIRSGWFIILGYLGEGWEDILLTRELIREERPDEIGVSVAYPLPGTKFYDIVRAQLGKKRNWLDTDDLDMIFPGTYETAFYKQIRDLLHDEMAVPATGSGEVRRQLAARWTELKRQENAFRSS